MFELKNLTECELTNFTGRTQKAGREHVPAVSFHLLKKGVENTELDMFSTTLRQTIYMAVPGQEDLPGVEPSTPLLRSKDVTHLEPEFAYNGWTCWVAAGLNDDALQMEQCKVDGFKFTFHEGGKFDLTFRVGTADIDEGGAGMLWGRQKCKVFVRIVAPEMPAEPIDGTVGHPGLAAQRAEEAGQQRLDGLDEDAERRADDATGAFLGLQGHGQEVGGGDGHADDDGQPGGDDASGDGADLVGASPAEQAAAAHEEPRKRRRTAAQQFIDQHSAIE